MELSKEELGNMVKLFRKMGMTPKDDTPEDLKHWIHGMSQEEGIAIKMEDSSDTSKPQTSHSHPTSVSYQHFPRLPFFSGEHGKDTEYDLWRYEVDCLMESKTYSPEVILQALRKSLKGEAALVSMKLGHKATIAELLSKFKFAFGTLRSCSSLLSEFYSTSQHDDEDVATWSCRLERLLFQLTELKHISQEEQDDMLRSRLWDGLHSSLKSLAGYKYDAISNFDELRLCLRELEFDLNHGKRDTPKIRPKSATVKMASTTETAKERDLSELKDMMKELKAEISEMKEQQTQMSAQVYQCQSFIHPNPPSYEDRQHQSGSWRGRGRDPRRRECGQKVTWRGAQSGDAPQGAAAPLYQPPSPQQSQPTGGRITSQWNNTQPQGNTPICYRCGYPGHLAYGCRVLLDHQRRPLNLPGPMGRGYH
ncbi:uncharacterized protein [Haliotis cracherodii]|uniref:uncharacterized protein n=1 Tax=Haliotis cracherodii TaxID=6455 RepID=UPI0039EA2A3A